VQPVHRAVTWKCVLLVKVPALSTSNVAPWYTEGVLCALFSREGPRQFGLCVSGLLSALVVGWGWG
jgi:hypothetical protein